MYLDLVGNTLTISGVIGRDTNEKKVILQKYVDPSGQVVVLVIPVGIGLKVVGDALLVGGAITLGGIAIWETGKAVDEMLDPDDADGSKPLHIEIKNPEWISPEWGKNRLEKEARDRDFTESKETESGGGRIHKNPETGEEIRIMPKPKRRYRKYPPAKHENDYYYRYRPGQGQPEGPHTPIPNKP